jgi:hypothetical protein
MKRDPAVFRALALFAMLALIAAAFVADRIYALMRIQASQTFIALPALWVRNGLGLLVVLLAMLLALWVIAGSARSPLVHWVFLIVGLLLSFYAPLLMSGGILGFIMPSFLNIPLLWDDNVWLVARLLAVTGLLGLLLKPPKPTESD